jgi:hypothetical protein
MEKNNLYREYFPGYMGHIPMKNEVIGMTVGATNKFIKGYFTKEPDYEQTFVPSIYKDYTYYNRGYFNEGMSKAYELEEDKIFSNRSKEARTWISGNKHRLYPEHIPGYTGHVSGIEPAGKKGSPIFGMSYAKATSKAIKGEYSKDIDVPPEERYTSIQKASFGVPKMRSKEDMQYLERKSKEDMETTQKAVQYFEQLRKTNLNTNKEFLEAGANMSDSFKKAINYEKPVITELPYIVGYKGFRRGVVAGNYYGKNFREVSLTSINRAAEQE